MWTKDKKDEFLSLIPRYDRDKKTNRLFKSKQSVGKHSNMTNHEDKKILYEAVCSFRLQNTVHIFYSFLLSCHLAGKF